MSRTKRFGACQDIWAWADYLGAPVERDIELPVISEEIDHVLPVVVGIADQFLAYWIDNEIQRLQGNLTDQWRALIGDFARCFE